MSEFHLIVKDSHPELGLRLRVDYKPENEAPHFLHIDDWIPRKQILKAIQALVQGVSDLEIPLD